MQFQFSFKHMDTSKALQDYAHEKIKAQVEKFVTKPIEVQVTFLVDKHRQHASCSLIGGDGFRMNVEHACEDMYGSVDRVVDKLAAQLKRKKDRLKHHKTKNSMKKTLVDTSPREEELDAGDIVKFEQAKRLRVS